MATSKIGCHDDESVSSFHILPLSGERVRGMKSRILHPDNHRYSESDDQYDSMWDDSKQQQQQLFSNSDEHHSRAIAQNRGFGKKPVREIAGFALKIVGYELQTRWLNSGSMVFYASPCSMQGHAHHSF